MNQVLIGSIGSLLQITIVKIPVRMKGNRHAVGPLRSLRDTCVFPREPLFCILGGAILSAFPVVYFHYNHM